VAVEAPAAVAALGVVAVVALFLVDQQLRVARGPNSVTQTATGANGETISR